MTYIHNTYMNSRHIVEGIYMKYTELIVDTNGEIQLSKCKAMVITALSCIFQGADMINAVIRYLVTYFGWWNQIKSKYV